jgi:prevent-host-death family protein
MLVIGSSEAKINFSKLLRRVANGEEFIVTSHGKPTARLTQLEEENEKSLEAVLAGFKELRSAVAARGPVLKPGESWNDLAREGLKW